MIGVLLEGLEQLMEAVRSRFTVTMTVLGLAAWALVAAGGSWLFVPESPVFGVALSAGPLLLLVLTAIRGVGRIPWPVWPMGASTLVFIGGIFAPQAEEAPPEYRSMIAVLVFVYVQVFCGTLAAVDELRRRRRRRVGRTDPPETERIARRRALQLRVLVATQLLAFGGGLGVSPQQPPGGGLAVVQAAVLLLRIGIILVLLLAFVGVFARRKELAVVVAAGVMMAFTATLGLLEPAERLPMLAQHGWVVATTAYLWAKAARSWYWPEQQAATRAVPEVRGW